METLRHFKQHEIACKCCGKMPTSQEAIYFARDMDCLRDSFGFSFEVNSWFRCEKHNQEVGGVKGSAHTLGIAADIDAPDAQKRAEIVARAAALGFRVVLYPAFVHLDKDKSKPAGLHRSK